MENSFKTNEITFIEKEEKRIKSEIKVFIDIKKADRLRGSFCMDNEKAILIRLTYLNQLTKKKKQLKGA